MWSISRIYFTQNKSFVNLALPETRIFEVVNLWSTSSRPNVTFSSQWRCYYRSQIRNKITLCHVYINIESVSTVRIPGRCACNNLGFWNVFSYMICNLFHLILSKMIVFFRKCVLFKPRYMGQSQLILFHWRNKGLHWPPVIKSQTKVIIIIW